MGHAAGSNLLLARTGIIRRRSWTDRKSRSARGRSCRQAIDAVPNAATIVYVQSNSRRRRLRPKLNGAVSAGAPPAR